MAGILEGDRVLVKDEKEGSTLYNKGAFGIPQSGGGLELNLLEAVYLHEQNRLDVKNAKGQPVAMDDLLAAAAAGEALFETRYATYRDLRQRTFVVRVGKGDDFAILPPGALPGRDRAQSHARATSERSPFRAGDVAREAAQAQTDNRRFLLSVVDEEGEVTYYKTKTTPPQGRTPASLEGVHAHALMLRDRAFVTRAQDVDALTRAGHFGRPAGPGLALSLVELVHLTSAGAVRAEDAETRQPLGPEAVAQRARELEPDFDLRYAAYASLRAQDLVVKTGFKFGSHFRAYPVSPDEGHAPFLIHALAADATLSWPEVAGFIRLAHGVRKRMLFFVDGTYVELQWTKP